MDKSAARAPVAITARSNSRRLPSTSTAWPDKAPVADKHVDAKLAEPLRGIMGADAGAQLAHPLHSRRKIDASRSAIKLHAELFAVARFRDRARRAYKPLRRHAADVEAVATHEIALDQSATLAPSPAAPAALTKPAVPAPITTRLYFPAGTGFAQWDGWQFSIELLVVRVIDKHHFVEGYRLVVRVEARPFRNPAALLDLARLRAKPCARCA